MSWPWSELGLPGPSDLTAIKHAYAQRLKDVHPEEDPEGFQRLHSAYQTARRLAKRPAPPQPEPEETDEDVWDDEELLWGQTDTPRGEDDEADWDYDELLSEQLEQSHEEDAQADWDYDALISQGDAERIEARRRRAEARRTAQEREQRERAKNKEETWCAVEGSLHALEILHSSDAPLSEWKKFFRSPMFLRAKSELDFIFGLEDFLNLHKSLSWDIKKVIFTAYGFQQGIQHPIYRPVYRLLADCARPRIHHIKQIRLGAGRLTIGLAALLLCVTLITIVWEQAQPTGPELLCTYLEEDFGQPFHYVSKVEGKAAVYVFAPDGDETLLFQAARSGNRDSEQGQRGYNTNYTNALLYRAIRAFAQEWDCPLTYDVKQQDTVGMAPGESAPPRNFVFELPLTGAGDWITALAARLAEVEQAPWYKFMPPKFQILLNHGGTTICRYYTEEDGQFDGDYIRARYETQYGYAYAKYLLEESGVARADLGLDSYVLLEQGMVQVDERRYFWINGLEKPPSNQERMYYYISDDGLEIYAEEAHQAETQQTYEGLDGFVLTQRCSLPNGGEVAVYRR